MMFFVLFVLQSTISNCLPTFPDSVDPYKLGGIQYQSRARPDEPSFADLPSDILQQNIMPLLEKSDFLNLIAISETNQRLRSLTHEYKGSMPYHTKLRKTCGPANSEMLLKYFYGQRENVVMELDLQRFENWPEDLYEPSESEYEGDGSDSENSDENSDVFEDITMLFHSQNLNNDETNSEKQESGSSHSGGKEDLLYKVVQPSDFCLKAISEFCQGHASGLSTTLNSRDTIPRLQIKVFNSGEHSLRRLQMLSGCEIGLDIVGGSFVNLASLPRHNVKLSYINALNADIKPYDLQEILSLTREPENELTYLVLTNNHIGEEGAQQISEALVNPNNRLTHIALKDTEISVEGVVLISQVLNHPNCNLVYLDLSSNELLPETIYPLAEALSHNSKLRLLDLSGYNPIGDEGVVAISAALENPESKLEMLYLGYTEMTSEGLSSLLKVLETKNTRLNWLDLRGNDLGNDGAAMLARYISSGRNNISHLDLQQCKINSEGGVAIAKALKTPRNGIMDLQLASNEIGPDGGVEFARVLGNPNNQLRVLGLNKNDISGGEFISELVDKMASDFCKLEYLIIGRNSLTINEMSRLNNVSRQKNINLKLI